MQKASWSSYVRWSGMVLVLALVTFTPVVARSFGPHRATMAELLVDYTILACSIGLTWVLLPVGPGTTCGNARVVIWLLGAAAVAAAILAAHDAMPEAMAPYFTIPFLRATHPSRSTYPPLTPARWALFAFMICGALLGTAAYFRLEAW